MLQIIVKSMNIINVKRLHDGEIGKLIANTLQAYIWK